MNISILYARELYKMLAVVAISALVLGTMNYMFSPRAATAAPGYVLTGNLTQNNLQVDVSGVASADPYVGQDNQQAISVNWDVDGSGSFETVLDYTGLNFDPNNAANHTSIILDTPWATSHTYSVPGTYKIEVLIHHSQPSGNESGSAVFTQTVTVTTAATGSITVMKHTDDSSGDSASFDFTGDLGAFSVLGDNSHSFASTSALAGTSYTITETTKAGWDFDHVSCDSGSWNDNQDGSLTIDLAKDDNLTCTFYNTMQIVQPSTSTVSICKKDPTGAPLSGWDVFITDAQQQSYGGTTDGSGCVESTDVPYGDYTLGETLQQGWTNVSGNGDAVTVGNPTETFTLVNEQIPAGKAILTLIKNVDNTGGGTASATDWTLQASSTALRIFGPTGSDNVTNIDVDPGTYALSEFGGPSNYDPSDWVCRGATGSTANSVTLAANDTATCTITNTYNPPAPTTGTLLVKKEVVSGSATSSDFTLNVFDGVSTTSDPGSAIGTSYTLDPGTYYVTEDATSTYTSSFASCGTNGMVTVTAGTTTICTVQNRLLPPPDMGQIVIKKEVTAGSDTQQSFHFNLSWDKAGADLSDGQSTTSNVLANQVYDISEDVPSEWTQQNVTCTSTDPQHNVNPLEFGIANQEVITCTYTNAQTMYDIFGYVWNDANSNGVFDEEENPLQGWSVHATNGSTTKDTTSDSNGYYHFSVPAGTWTISEDVQSGWEQTYPTTTTHTVTVGGQITEANSNSFLAMVMNFLIPTANAQFAGAGPLNFGNNFVGGGIALTCTLSVNDHGVNVGDHVTLTWTSTGADDASIDQGVGTVALNGSQDVVIANKGTTVYTLTVSKKGGASATCSDSTKTSGLSGGGITGGGGPTPQVLGISTTTGPIPQVLPASITLPVGAPNTGAGGTSHDTSFPTMVTILGMLAAVATIRATRQKKD